MRFTRLQAILLPLLGHTPRLVKAQPCDSAIVDFEDLNTAGTLGMNSGLNVIVNGYHNLNWGNLYAVTPSPLLQFLLPQGKVYVSTIASSGSNTATISSLANTFYQPVAIFAGTFQTGLLNSVTSLSIASTITVTATFTDGTTDQTTFSLTPINTLLGLGLALNAESLQRFTFPCEWYGVVSLTFVPQSADPNVVLGVALDNFETGVIIPGKV